MKLVLQTTIPGRISVWLVQEQRIIADRSIDVEWHGSDRALAFLDLVLRGQKKTIHDLKGIVVVRGPGSFTAVRTGLIIANTLASALRIPSHGVVKKQPLTPSNVLSVSKLRGKTKILIRPWYGKSPNITRPKKRQPQARAKR